MLEDLSLWVDKSDREVRKNGDRLNFYKNAVK